MNLEVDTFVYTQFREIENSLSRNAATLPRRSKFDVIPALGDAIAAALATITPADCHNCFEACGYARHLK